MMRSWLTIHNTNRFSKNVLSSSKRIINSSSVLNNKNRSMLLLSKKKDMTMRQVVLQHKYNKQKLASSFTTITALSDSSSIMSSSLSFMTMMMMMIAFFETNHNYLFEEEESSNNDHSSMTRPPTFPLFDWQMDKYFINNSTSADLMVLSFEETKSKILDYLSSIYNEWKSDEQQKESHTTISASEVKFPSLEANLLVNEKMEPFTLNSNEPIPINNDLFEGHVMLSLKPSSNDPSPNQMPFVFRLQGRFKKSIPYDELMIGAQTTNQLAISSSWMKQIVDWVLKCLSIRMNSPMTYSFGTNSDDDSSLPHISFPLHTGLERVIKQREETTIATSTFQQQSWMMNVMNNTIQQKSNDTKQQQQLIIEESSSETFLKQFNNEEDNIIIKGKNDSSVWEKDVLYSMEYTADAIDLSNWKLISPLEINLTRFWGTSPVRLVIYHKEENNLIDYVFNLQLKYLGNKATATNEVENTNEAENNNALLISC